MAVRMAALRAGRALVPRDNFWYSFVRGWINPRAIMRLEALGKLKEKINYLIRTRTRDLPACSIMPQPAMLPCAPAFLYVLFPAIIWGPIDQFSWKLTQGSYHFVYCIHTHTHTHMQYTKWRGPHMSFHHNRLVGSQVIALANYVKMYLETSVKQNNWHRVPHGHGY
jgi:hypothetical protein